VKKKIFFEFQYPSFQPRQLFSTETMDRSSKDQQQPAQMPERQSGVRKVDSAEILRGDKRIEIQHRGELYRLVETRKW